MQTPALIRAFLLLAAAPAATASPAPRVADITKTVTIILPMNGGAPYAATIDHKAVEMVTVGLTTTTVFNNASAAPGISVITTDGLTVSVLSNMTGPLLTDGPVNATWISLATPTMTDDDPQITTVSNGTVPTTATTSRKNAAPAVVDR